MDYFSGKLEFLLYIDLSKIKLEHRAEDETSVGKYLPEVCPKERSLTVFSLFSSHLIFQYFPHLSAKMSRSHITFIFKSGMTFLYVFDFLKTKI